ncbi:YbhB/YbcL family Raf kinase inhibitor-like protein [Streptacidiphilus carbonis]|uniref:YbhB/YbcL family Raf kinase inhibitor-like protein n=1 Tax=Streptacidiphilus carbonis TaxID=105422 RepID=UPI0005AB5BDA|nr:YbhB/YbcL family Raf kinase inhibitor-like protein [Streptacidiphilus carbonis]
MTILGTLLRNHRAGETHLAWNQPRLHGPELLDLTSRQFQDGGPIPQEHVAKRYGGKDLSPDLAWTPPPEGTAQLLLAVEDLDVPMARPAVHCLALIDPAALASPHRLPTGGLSGRAPAAGVTVLRSTIGRGYHGPGPIKGHGPHRYTFQLFALAAAAGGDGPGAASPARAAPRAVLSSVAAPVLARGRLTGTYER